MTAQEPDRLDWLDVADATNVAPRIKRERARFGWSLDELLERMELPNPPHRATIGRIERGEQMPKTDELLGFCRAFRMTPEELTKPFEDDAKDAAVDAKKAAAEAAAQLTSAAATYLRSLTALLVIAADETNPAASRTARAALDRVGPDRVGPASRGRVREVNPPPALAFSAPVVRSALSSLAREALRLAKLEMVDADVDKGMVAFVLSDGSVVSPRFHDGVRLTPESVDLTEAALDEIGGPDGNR